MMRNNAPGRDLISEADCRMIAFGLAELKCCDPCQDVDRRDAERRCCGYSTRVQTGLVRSQSWKPVLCRMLSVLACLSGALMRVCTALSLAVRTPIARLDMAIPLRPHHEGALAAGARVAAFAQLEPGGGVLELLPAALPDHMPRGAAPIRRRPALGFCSGQTPWFGRLPS